MNHSEFPRRRAAMVERYVVGRNVHAARVLDALRAVPRERFVPHALLEFAFDDVSLPIPEGLLLPRPSEVGVMLAALDLKAQDKVLEIGTGVGYVTALLSRLCASVYSIEPQGPAALAATAMLARLDCHNVQIRHDSGAQGWPEEAPFDAIVVHASARHVPRVLREQLVPGGRLVMALGDDPEVAELVRVTRLPDDQFRVEDMADIGPDPALGEAPHAHPHAGAMWRRPAGGKAAAGGDAALARLVADAAQAFDSVESADLEPLLQRVGQARVVLLGEATHGTSEFYRMPACTRVDRTQRCVPSLALDWVPLNRKGPAMSKQWILVANGSLARFFSRAGAGDPLVALKTIDFPQGRLKEGELEWDRQGHQSSDNSTAAAHFEPHTSTRQKVMHQFACELAARLEEGLARGEYEALWLTASSPFLGALKAALSHAVAARLQWVHDADFTSLDASALETRLLELRLPAR